MTKDEIDNVLRSWHTLNKAIGAMTEVDCKQALEREMSGNRRKDLAVRIHQKYNSLRLTRERTEMVNLLSDVPAFLMTGGKV